MNETSTTMQRVRRALTPRENRLQSDDGVALVSTVLFMIMLSGLSLVLLSVLLGQISPAYVAQKSTRTVNAAQAGLQSALASVRSASALDAQGRTFGAKSKLPCAFSGRVDGEDSEASYTVTLSYFRTDPTHQTDSWRLSNSISCSPTAGVSVQPGFALLVSKGAGTSAAGRDANEANRAISAVYTFQLSNENIAGGRILNGTRCMEATSASTGALIKFSPAAQCIDANKDLQLWVYDDDYEIKLASTLVSASPGVPAAPMCITGPIAGVASERAQLQACRSGNDRWNQLWSWTGDQTWRGQKPDRSDISDYRMQANADNYLHVTQGAVTALSPDASVGAGAARKETNQIVNFKEFGRCADVTGEQIDSDYMIVYPCKQDPSTTGPLGGILWNHKFYYDEPTAPATSRVGQIKVQPKNTSDPAVRRCLQTAPETGSVKDVTLEACVNNADNQKWKRFYNTGTYAESYVFQDAYGRCLAADTTSLHSGFSKMRMQACDGGPAQKWNAPPTSNEATVGGYKEVG